MTTPPEGRRSPMSIALPVMLAIVVSLFVIELVDTWILDDRFERQGIMPREVSGLDGVAWAPMLHDDFTHVVANALPLLVLGGLVLLRGVDRFLQVTAVVVVVGGLATWLLARSGNHIGASGLVFGYLGYLLASAFFERSFRAIVVAVLVGLLYGGLLWGVLPTNPAISFEGHLFGLLAGILAARVTAPRRAAPAVP